MDPFQIRHKIPSNHLKWMIEMADAHDWFSENLIMAMTAVAEGKSFRVAAKSAGYSMPGRLLHGTMQQMRKKAGDRTRFLNLVFWWRPIKWEP